jgi:four helix bundle protein
LEAPDPESVRGNSGHESGLRHPIRSYRDIEAYQRAMALLPRVHRLAVSLPDFERYELASQIRRASKSIPSNIAEGYGKKRSAREFRAFLANALGSTNELVVHLEMAKVLGYAAERECEDLVNEYSIVGKQLNRLMSTWRRFQPPNSNV